MGILNDSTESKVASQPAFKLLHVTDAADLLAGELTKLKQPKVEFDIENAVYPVLQ